MALGKFVRLGSGLVPFTSLSPRRTGPHLVGGWLRGWQAIYNHRSTLLRGLTNHGPWLLIAELGWSTKQCLAEMEPFRQGWHCWLEDLTSDVGERWMDCNVVCTRRICRDAPTQKTQWLQRFRWTSCCCCYFWRVMIYLHFHQESSTTKNTWIL